MLCRAVGSNSLVVRPTSHRPMCIENLQDDEWSYMLIVLHTIICICSMLRQGVWWHAPRKILKRKSSEIEFKGFSGSYSCMLYQLHDQLNAIAIVIVQVDLGYAYSAVSALSLDHDFHAKEVKLGKIAVNLITIFYQGSS